MKISEITEDNYSGFLTFLLETGNLKLWSLAIVFEQNFIPIIPWYWPFNTHGPFTRRKIAKKLVSYMKENLTDFEMILYKMED